MTSPSAAASVRPFPPAVSARHRQTLRLTPTQAATSPKHDSPAPGTATKASASNPAHLARVRENQRRSRARRRGYLQELEERFRRCEANGVEASAEMQAAARRVLEENRRLKAFLRSKGYSEGELAGWAAVGPADDAPDDRSKAVEALEALITRRKTCSEARPSAERPLAPSAPPPQQRLQPQLPLPVTQQYNPQYPPTTSGPHALAPLHAQHHPSPWPAAPAGYYVPSGGSTPSPSSTYTSPAWSSKSPWLDMGQSPSASSAAAVGSEVEDLLSPELEAQFLSGIHGGGGVSGGAQGGGGGY